MRETYLGDSYDIVKRFWRCCLEKVGPLRGHPRFVPRTLHRKYEAMTGIPVLGADEVPAGRFGVLMDPSTGIPLPGESSPAASLSHAPLPFIASEMGRLRPSYAICFDQTVHRRHQRTRRRQLRWKQAWLRQRRLPSFYYDSHAPFLFLAPTAADLARVRDALVSAGVPSHRLRLRR